MNDWIWSSLPLAKPELFMSVAGMLLLVIGAFRKDNATMIISGGVVAVFAMTACMLMPAASEPEIGFSGHFIADHFGAYMKLLVLIGLAAAVTISTRYMIQENMARFEYPVLVLFAGVGMMVMLSANSLLAVYVGLELQSLSLYVLAAIRRDHAQSSEAGLKYFVLGALASGMLLFGISLLYGYVGAVGFDAIGRPDDLGQNAGALVGMVFVLVGVAFKISAVPFHMWTPDVYEGAPTCVTALFAMVPKVAAMGLLMRLLFGPFNTLMHDWQQIIWFLSAASMALGAFAALMQNNIKRLLAYSSIGNMGYAMVGLVAGTAPGVGAVILYMTIYMVMTAGTFGLILLMRRNGDSVEKISDMAGLSKTNPSLAYAMAIMMFSMSGIPPLAGFFAKLFIFQAAVAAGFYVLAVFGVVTSVVAAYYYLRIIKVMFFDENVSALDAQPSFGRKAVVGLSLLVILGFVLMPEPLIESSRAAAATLFTGG